MKKIFVMMVLAFSAMADLGNERGGGMPPPPTYFPEDASYACSVKLTQLSTELGRPLVSRATTVFSWKKGEYAGRRGADLKDLQWKHYKLVPYGPFHLDREEEIASAPTSAVFEGSVALYSPSPMPGANPDLAALGAGMPIGLVVSTGWTDAQTLARTEADATSFQTLQSKKDLRAQARVKLQSQQSDLWKQSNIDVTCKVAK